MGNFIKRINSFWVSDVSFPALLTMLFFTVFVLPVFIEYQKDATLFLNIMLILLFFVGIFSSHEKPYLILSSVLFLLHISLRLIRFGDNPYEFYLFERVVAILNLTALVIINFSLLFRNNEVNIHRIIGSVNVYLLLAMIGAFGFEVIHLITGESLEGNKSLGGLDADYGEYIYYSLSCISTLGFGDVFPANLPTKMLSVFLSASGILYPAVVIAKLVSYAAKEN
ncbi:potassium channel family protein [Belliella sp. R4-6]|uniref:Potassium channel family protein n=1 Tax=Belliella alkalica TaxID=1730871 RepID=A0ABS9VC35_9BACT|nr:potassium channel family protein [Belliella alkalica]MCH7413923.1 potassium channel family protein [Belliella alkalica]